MSPKRVLWTVLGAVALGALLFVLLTYWDGLDRTARAVSHVIRDALVRHDMPDDAPWRDRRTQTLVRAFYVARRMRPAWTNGAGPTNQSRELSDALLVADTEGLRPKEYSALEISRALQRNEGTLLSTGDPKALAEFDLTCTIAALHYMSDVSDGRISPKSLDAVWVARPRKGDLDATLQTALRKNAVGTMLREMAPSHDGYRKLRDARAQYAQIVSAGGWKPIPPGRPLRRGQHGPRVAALRARLAASGDTQPSGKNGDVFDESLAKAVARFQSRYGRDPDGIVGPTELGELNVPAVERLRQIELNMERWRWLPKELGDRYLLVNIPEYMLRIFEGGRPAISMRVVVGKALSATPVFSDQMTQVVLNPTWNVPASIAEAEMVPAVRDDPEYLAEHALRVFDGTGDDAKEVDPRSVHWSDDSATQRVNFRQDPGDSNALGRIKFLFPNQFDVYLHDTPAGHLFSLEDRGLSHGCIRVEYPIQLASYVLRGLPESNPDSIRQMIESRETRTITIPHPLPVDIVYFTAFVDDDGSVGFREDVYGIDQNLIEQLWGHAEEQSRQ